ncbi:MAG TPA: Maf family protein [Clostridiales bacterium]|nr:Maf family protein [Clostridiales bacterium]
MSKIREENANRIILASASPRRSDLLKQAGIPFLVVPGEVNEESLNLEGEPEKQAEKSALIKALDVAEKFGTGLVLGADTIVVFDNQIYGKPGDKKHAYNMLKSLQGRIHHVITGIAIVDASTGVYKTAHEKTSVYFTSLNDDEIWSYINSGEPFGKAGAYAIQGKGALFVEKIDGCYTNVVGLPLLRVKKLLEEFCLKYRNL